MKKDIEYEADIEMLVNSFYSAVKQDDVIGHIFNTIIGDDWSGHLPVMYKFWGSVLLSKPGYTGNPIKKHVELDKIIPVSKEHFERWLLIWNTTVDELFEGEVAELAKTRAGLMANLINIKIESARTGLGLA
ncbi:MAG: group III truncated hemoglobin [Bacteroidota bacterium]